MISLCQQQKHSNRISIVIHYYITFYQILFYIFLYIDWIFFNNTISDEYLSYTAYKWYLSLLHLSILYLDKFSEKSKNHLFVVFQYFMGPFFYNIKFLYQSPLIFDIMKKSIVHQNF